MRNEVTVLYGGISNEREVSLRSGRAVISAAEQAGFVVKDIDITNPNQINELKKASIVLPIFHGKYGEDGKVQAQLEAKGIKFLGSNSEASKNCFDKQRTKDFFAGHNLPIARGEIVHSVGEYYASPLRENPHVLKIANGGSSIGTLIVRDLGTKDEDDVKKLFALESKAILEELVDGTEITVPVLRDSALPVIEIAAPHGQEFDYENKYNGASAEICPARSIPEDKQKEAQKLAEKVHKTMNCRHLSRIDMIVKDNGEIILLEVNTMPGLTDNSLYPIAAKVAGYDMSDLVGEFVKMAEEG